MTSNDIEWLHSAFCPRNVGSAVHDAPSYHISWKHRRLVLGICCCNTSDNFRLSWKRPSKIRLCSSKAARQIFEETFGVLSIEESAPPKVDFWQSVAMLNHVKSLGLIFHKKFFSNPLRRTSWTYWNTLKIFKGHGWANVRMFCDWHEPKALINLLRDLVGPQCSTWFL